jgi:hypothetical protein
MAKILFESQLKIHTGWGSEFNMASIYVHLNEDDVADDVADDIFEVWYNG